MSQPTRPIAGTDPVEPETGEAVPFGEPQSTGGSLTVNLNAQELNLHPSNLGALERIAMHNPALAGKIMDVTNSANKFNFRQYRVGATAATLIAMTILVCSTLVILYVGFWAGIVFFMTCVAVSAIVSAVFTGTSQDLSWTVGLVSGRDRGTGSGEDEPTS